MKPAAIDIHSHVEFADTAAILKKKYTEEDLRGFFVKLREHYQGREVANDCKIALIALDNSDHDTVGEILDKIIEWYKRKFKRFPIYQVLFILGCDVDGALERMRGMRLSLQA